MLTYKWEYGGKFVYLTGDNNPYTSPLTLNDLENEIERDRAFVGDPDGYKAQFYDNVANHIGESGNTTAWTKYYTNEISCGDNVINFVEVSQDIPDNVWAFSGGNLSATIKGSENEISKNAWGSIAEGYRNKLSASVSHIEGGDNIVMSGSFYSHTEGYNNSLSGYCGHVEGEGNSVSNKTEHAEGCNNISHKATENYGDSGNTQHSIGINEKNAIEVMQNGDVYIYGIGGYEGIAIGQDKTLKHALENIVDIRQTSGTSSSATISQKGITELLNNGKNEFTLLKVDKISGNTKSKIEIVNDIYVYGIGGYTGTTGSTIKTLREYLNEQEEAVAQTIAELKAEIEDLKLKINK